MASERRALVRDAAVILTAFVATGALCGWLWHAWWAPAPSGTVVNGSVYFPPDEAFTGTATYMTVAAAAGLVLGAVCTRLFERDEVVTLAAVLAGSVVAGLVMASVGSALGPEPAADVAARAANFEQVSSELDPGPLPAYLAFPGGALVAAVVVLVTFGRRTAPPSGD